MVANDGLIFMYLITPTSIILNIMVIVTLRKGFKNEPTNVRFTLLNSLSISELFVSVVGFSLQTFFKTHDTCIVAGHIVACFSLISLTHMVSLTVERFLAVKYPFKSEDWLISKKVIVAFLVPTWLYGFVWGSLFNMIGWGAIIYESKETHRCSIDFISTDPIRKSYVYCLLVFCYIIPIITTISFFLIIKRELHKMRQFIADNLGEDSKISKDTVKEEKRFSILVAVMLVCFLISWTPYAISVFYWKIKGNIKDTVFFDMCAYFGKTSSLWNPIIYFFVYKKFRTAFLRWCPFTRNWVQRIEPTHEQKATGHIQPLKDITNTNF
uniref:Opsin 7 n=1 Tax=Clytia hemisphaerica TaxID=252671 RepID=A0A2I6SFS4_9CNID|nr:opsin 7 [Clytia hemisphaerica]